MPAIAVNQLFPIFTDADGQPLDDAYIYIGAANQNPVSNPITVYWDSALTIPASQPIRTSGGYPVRNGTPARFYANSDYSILVRDKNGAFVYTAPKETDFTSSEFIIFVQSGTGAVSRTEQSKLRDVVSVKDFGAVGDGITDDSVAFQNALNASGSIYVPAGVYALNSGITFTDTAVYFYGDGKETTELRFGSVAIGIKVNNALSFSPVEIKNMSITTTNALGGTAIDITWPETYDGRLIHKGTIDGLQIQGANNETQGWSIGIKYTQGCFVTVSNCGILGRDTGGTASGAQTDKTASQIGIYWTGGVYPVDIRVQNCFINCWEYGFWATGAPEGLLFHNDSFLNCRYGIYARPTTFSPGIGGGSALFRPQLNVSDCHASCYETCVYSYGMVTSTIHDNLFYIRSNGNQDANMLDIQQTGGMLIHHNEFQQFSTTYNVNGIVVSNVTSPTGIVQISENYFSDMSIGLWLKSTAERVRHYKNVYSGVFSFTAIYDQGVSNVQGSRTCLVSRTTDLSNTSGAAQAVVWDSISNNTAGVFSGGVGTSAFTIPSNTGIRRVRLTANLYFSGNAAGFRDAFIQYNGSASYAGSPAGTTDPNGTDYVGICITTPILNVNPGDTFVLFAGQTSGSTLSLLGNGRTWFSLEVIE